MYDALTLTAVLVVWWLLQTWLLPRLADSHERLARAGARTTRTNRLKAAWYQTAAKLHKETPQAYRARRRAERRVIPS
jgi:hypothetical protein